MPPLDKGSWFHVSTLTSDPTLGTTSTIGRYFGIVSVVPSLFFGVWTYLLVASKPWEGPPDLSDIATVSPAEAVVLGIGLVLFSLLVAVVTHPLQFLAVQAFEGYWGASRFGLAMQERRIAAHIGHRLGLEDTKDESNRALRRIKGKLGLKADDVLNWSDAISAGQLAPLLAANVRYRGSDAALGAYPELHENVMPTRLGNVLRGYEVAAGGAVGLDLITWANHIGMVAEPTQTAYVQDQRNGMDLAVRMTVTCLGMFGLTIIMFWPHGLWLLVALLPLAGGWLSYRGAVVAADSYGRALTAWLHLNRFRLYEALGLPPIATSQQERTQNKGLVDLVRGQPEYTGSYGARRSAARAAASTDASPDRR
jgi:hypothetical protein